MSDNASESGPAIRVRGLETRFGKTVIHDALDLDIRRGEILGIVGASGTGKSVLLREILLLEAPAAGTIEILGDDTSELDAAGLRRLRCHMGVLFQHGALFTGLTVRQNVALVIREHARLAPAFCDTLAGVRIAMSGLPAAAADRYPDTLSGGMIKRAALARALALDPPLLFLDEPTSGLDPVSTRAFDDRIRELQGLLGLTVVMVTHDPGSLLRTTDRVAFLAHGRVHALETPARLMESSDPEIRAYFHGSQPTAAAGA